MPLLVPPLQRAFSGRGYSKVNSLRGEHDKYARTSKIQQFINHLSFSIRCYIFAIQMLNSQPLTIYITEAVIVF